MWVIILAVMFLCGRWAAFRHGLLIYADTPSSGIRGGVTRTELLDLSGVTEVLENTDEGWRWEPDDSDGGVLTLTNCHIRTVGQSVIKVRRGNEESEGSRITIVLEGENILEIAPGADNKAFYGPIISSISQNYVIRGTGSLALSVSGEAEPGRYSYGFSGYSITIESGEITSDICICTIRDHFTVKGGQLTITTPAGSNENAIYTDRGDVNFEGGTVNLNADRHGIAIAGMGRTGTQNVNISGGEVTIEAGVSCIFIANDGEELSKTLYITGGRFQGESRQVGFYARNVVIAGEGAAAPEVSVHTSNTFAQGPAVWAIKDVSIGGDARVSIASDSHFGIDAGGVLTVKDAADVTVSGVVDADVRSVQVEGEADLCAMIREDSELERRWTVYGDYTLKKDMVLEPFMSSSGEMLPAVMTLAPGSRLIIPDNRQLTIDESSALMVPEDTALVVGAGAKLYNEGEIYMDGSLSGSVEGMKEQYPVIVEGGSAEAEELSPCGYYKEGTEIVLSPDLPDGKRLKEWQAENITFFQNEEGMFLFRMPAHAVTVTAVFENIPVYTIEAEISPLEGGVVTGQGEYEEGTAITMTARENDGYRFVKWTEDRGDVSTDRSIQFVVSADRRLTAVFERTEEKPPETASYTVEVKVGASGGGTVTGGGEYKAGSYVTVMATEESGYEFRGWTENNILQSTEAAYTFEVTGNRVLTASFEKREEIAKQQVQTPVIIPNGGTFKGQQHVTIFCGTPGASIYYTTDGSVPALESPQYREGFVITENTEVKAFAVKDGMEDSKTASARFIKASDSSSGDGTVSGDKGDQEDDRKDDTDSFEEEEYESVEEVHSASNASDAGKWLRDERGWRYQYIDGKIEAGRQDLASGEQISWKYINQSWWAFGADGYMKEGWVSDKQSGHWYYIDTDTGMRTGWYLDQKDGEWYYLEPENGHMLMGWQKINGSWYYLNPVSTSPTWFYDISDGSWHYDTKSKNKPLGAMYRSGSTPDGYEVDGEGRWKYGL